MKINWDYEGQGLEWLFRGVWVFAVIGVVSMTGFAMYALWKVFA